MNRYLQTIVAASLYLVVATQSFGKECELDNKAHRAMPNIEVTYTLANGEQHGITAKLADNNATRAAGFQSVCASVIADKPIFFLFQREQTPSFHMNNVVAPIDIVFIDKNGAVDSFHAMQTYSMVQLSKPLYSSIGPVIAALETQPGFFSEVGIDSTTTFSWRELPGDSGG